MDLAEEIVGIKSPLDQCLTEITSEYDDLRSANRAPLNPVCYTLGAFVTDRVIFEDDKHYGKVDTSTRGQDFVLRDASQIYFYIVPPETEADWKKPQNRNQVSLEPIFEDNGKGPTYLWRARIIFPENRKFYSHEDGSNYQDKNFAIIQKLIPPQLVLGDLEFDSIDPLTNEAIVTLVGTSSQARNLEIAARVMGKCVEYKVTREEKPPGHFTRLKSLLDSVLG